MTFHLYVKPDGFPDILPYELKLDSGLYPGYRYLGESAEKPDVGFKKYVNGQWVWGGSEPEYISKRRKAYPTLDLLLALWQAMDDGILPKVAGFYDRIDEVNKRFPKQ
jgi:hypothetical protein